MVLYFLATAIGVTWAFFLVKLIWKYNDEVQRYLENDEKE